MSFKLRQNKNKEVILFFHEKIDSFEFWFLFKYYLQIYADKSKWAEFYTFLLT